jgi:hypothetical protein
MPAKTENAPSLWEKKERYEVERCGGNENGSSYLY